MKFPAPNDWDEEQDGYCVLFACIPNSQEWRALYRGLFYQPTWWKFYDKDGPPFNPAIQIAKQVYEGLCMTNCDDIVTQLTRIADALEGETVEQTKAVRELTAAVASVSIDTTQPVPDNVDYSGEAGLAGKFVTHNWLSPDQVIGDILANSLFGRYVDPIPNPLEGDGIADILDDRIQQTLERCLVMPDSSIFNLFGTKNVPETLETLLRIDSHFDLEILTNITSVLSRALNVGDATLVGQLRNWIAGKLKEVNLPNQEVQAWIDWFEEKIGVEEQVSLAEILMLVAGTDKEGRGLERISKAIRDAQMNINLNNYNGCCDEEDCNCSDAETQTFNLLDLCEQEEVPVNGNGSGPAQV